MVEVFESELSLFAGSVDEVFDGSSVQDPALEVVSRPWPNLTETLRKTPRLTGTQAHRCTGAQTHTDTQIDRRTDTYTHTHTLTHARTLTHTHAHTHTHTPARAHTHTHTPTHPRTHTHTHTHTYLPTYLHTYIHTYIQTYIHTHTHPLRLEAWCPSIELSSLQEARLDILTQKPIEDSWHREPRAKKT